MDFSPGRIPENPDFGLENGQSSAWGTISKIGSQSDRRQRKQRTAGTNTTVERASTGLQTRLQSGDSRNIGVKRAGRANRRVVETAEPRSESNGTADTAFVPNSGSRRPKLDRNPGKRDHSRGRSPCLERRSDASTRAVGVRPNRELTYGGETGVEKRQQNTGGGAASSQSEHTVPVRTPQPPARCSPKGSLNRGAAPTDTAAVRHSDEWHAGWWFEFSRPGGRGDR